MEGESGVSPSLPLPLPVLVHDLGNQDDDSSQTHYSISTQSLSTAAIDELRDYRCFETPQGWVLALDPASLQTFLWRPQDGERIQLPPVADAFPERCKCVLSDKPAAGAASGSCAVVVFDLDDREMWVCKVGASEWDNYSYTLTIFLGAGNNPRETHIAQRNGVAAVGGKIYYELTASELGVIEFDPATELGSIDVYMVDLPPSMPLASTYLVESCGDLFLAVIFFDGYNVHKVAELAVYKMDFSTPAWCKVDGIGDDRVFLLGGDRMGISNFGASCSAGGDLRGNCVYFLNHLASTENFVHVFELEKGTQQVQRPYRHKGFPLPLRAPFWLLPTE